MFSYINQRSKFETICAAISLLYLVVFTSTAWFLGVTYTLLFTFGVNLHTSSITTRGWTAVGFAIGVSVTFYVIAGGFLVYCWHRRRIRIPASRKQGFYNMLRRCHSDEPVYQWNFQPLVVHSTEFVRLVNLDSLLPLLLQMGLLSSSDFEDLLKSKTDRSSSRNIQILHMLTILDKKGKQGVCGVIQALKQEGEHTGHEELANILSQAYKYEVSLPSSYHQRSCSSSCA